MDKLEIKRQTFHALLGILLVLLIYYDFINWVGMLFVIILGFVISYLSKKTTIPIISWFLKKFEREKDMKKFPGKGPIFYLIGSFVVLVLFEKDIVLASIMILALGDSFSRLFGESIGKIKNPLNNKKFIEGMIFGFLAGFLGAMIFVGPVEAFFASLFAMIAECIEIKIGVEQVDDNIVIPFVAGATIFIMRTISL